MVKIKTGSSKKNQKQKKQYSQKKCSSGTQRDTNPDSGLSLGKAMLGMGILTGMRYFFSFVNSGSNQGHLEQG